LQEIYEATENQENLTLLCLSANYEPENPQEVAEDGIFKYATNIEMKDIKKNGLPKPVALRIEHKTCGVKKVWNGRKDFKGKIEGHKARSVAKDSNEKVDCDKVVFPSRLRRYRKTHTLSRCKIQVENSTNEPEVNLLNGVIRRRRMYMKQPSRYKIKCSS
jgi:hypothetical protein